MVLEVIFSRMTSTMLVYKMLSAPGIGREKIAVGVPIRRNIRAFEQSK